MQRIAREEARLRATFQRLLVLTLGSVGACSTSGGAPASGPGGAVLTSDAVDGGADATLGEGTGQAGSAGSAGTAGADPGGPGGAPGGGAGGPGGDADAGVDAAAAFGEGGACAPAVHDAGEVPDGDCGDYWRFACGLPPDVEPRSNCYLTLHDCSLFCAPGFFNCHAAQESCVDGSVPEAGAIVVECETCPRGVGRRPAGLADETPCASESPLGSYFAAMAHLEAASVHAFDALGEDLRSHGAPRSLVRMAARAARDEVRHARMTARLARRHRGVPRAPRVAARTSRSLVDVALENVVEGCVRETFGAMVASYQARAALDPGVRAAMARIAIDETRHAALSWAVARWSATRLDAASRARLDEARAEAVRALRAECAAPPAPELRVAAGVPDAATTALLLAALDDALWGTDESTS